MIDPDQDRYLNSFTMLSIIGLDLMQINRLGRGGGELIGDP